MRGFEVDSTSDEGYRVRRAEDQAVLPVSFAAKRVRSEADATAPIVAHTLLTPVATAITAIESLRSSWREFDDEARAALIDIIARQVNRTYDALECLARGTPEEALTVSAAE